jgi:rSAM/selenodomain-associated transferase 2
MKISVVIPVFNEEKRIGRLLESIYSANRREELLEEILVVDGGSTDNTVELSKKAGVQIYSTVKGRAVQMNLGAWKSKGEILHFIHADSIPPPSFLEDILDQYKQGYISGCFRSRFQTDSRLLLICSYFTRFNGLFFRGGGQTLWIERKLFRELTGFDERMEIMEEYSFIKQVSKRARFKVIPKVVEVSARDYERFGNFRLQFLYGIVYAMYFSGISQKKIKRFIKNRVKVIS